MNIHHALMMCKLCCLFVYFFCLNVYKQISGFKFCAQYLMAFPASNLFTFFFFGSKLKESVSTFAMCLIQLYIFSTCNMCKY